MILVTGATGNVGRDVVAQLLEAGEKVRAISRGPGTCRAAGRGGGGARGPVRLSVRCGQGVPVSGADLSGFLGLARNAGLWKVTLRSSSAVTCEKPNEIGLMHLAHERAVREPGLAWTFVRPGAFMANDLAWPGVRAGVVRAPYGAAAGGAHRRAGHRGGRRACWAMATTERPAN